MFQLNILLWRRLNKWWTKQACDELCESSCRKLYHQKLGRPSLALGIDIVAF